MLGNPGQRFAVLHSSGAGLSLAFRVFPTRPADKVAPQRVHLKFEFVGGGLILSVMHIATKGALSGLRILPKGFELHSTAWISKVTLGMMRL